MDPKAVSRMLGLLKYRSDPTSNKKGQDIEEAKHALEVYATLAPGAKKSFLADFEAGGRGKVKGSLRFALTYKRKLVSEESSEVSCVEDYYTKPQILEFNGLRWGDFAVDEANKLADQLLSDNKEEYGHGGWSKPHAGRSPPLQVLVRPQRRDSPHEHGAEGTTSWSRARRTRRRICQARAGRLLRFWPGGAREPAEASSLPAGRVSCKSSMLLRSALAALQKLQQQGSVTAHEVRAGRPDG